MKIKYLISSLFILSVLGCSPKDKSDVGYKDGFAAGYNTTCEIRATLIEGDWKNKSYKQGYNRGYIDGSNQCKKEKE